MRQGVVLSFAVLLAGLCSAQVSPVIWLPNVGGKQPEPASPPAVVPGGAIYGVSFADEEHVLYVPLREVGAALGWQIVWNASTGEISVNGLPLEKKERRALIDNTSLVSLSTLEKFGALVSFDVSAREAVVVGPGGKAVVHWGKKRAEVSLSEQKLRAWQGDKLIFETRVSTGRRGSTPAGEYTARRKERMHYSTLYDNAPMPWSVQLRGNYFIHGYKSVPNYPASHGCIRLPLKGPNPARWFFDWVEIGTPVSIVR